MYRSIKYLALAALLATTWSRATPLPSEKDHAISLDGQWRFKLEQSDPNTTFAKATIAGPRPAMKLPEHPEPFQTPDYKEDATWHDITVPGNWEMAGFSPATYHRPDNCIGIYRLSFEVPADWRGRLVKLNFDGIQNGAEIYLNGQPVNVDEPYAGRANYHEGGYDAFQADLTPAVKFGEKNLLAVRVYKNTDSGDMDDGDYFFLGGIHRTVTLFSVAPTHVDDLTVRTKLLEGGKAELRVLVDVAGAKDGKVAVEFEGQPPVQVPVATEGQTEIVQTLDHPKLWSAEHPNLYALSVKLLDAKGQSTEQITRRVGVREITINNGLLLVNGTLVKLTGMCRHDLDPALGSACNEATWRHDLMLMRAANVNAVRTSHYPYGSGFYDLCDELGFYVADELAACWTPTDTDALTPAFKQHARELVRRDKNHASVILWAVGNENKRGKNNKIAADEIRKLDPTRPRLVSWERGDVTGVELDDDHYTPPEKIEKDSREPRRATYPKTYLENPNVWEVRNGADYGCLDIWAQVMDRDWAPIWKGDHVVGSFLWEWRDRAVADHSPVKLYDHDPVTNINLAKVKGICDAFGNPRPTYYAVKMVYAPIKLDLTPTVTGSTVFVHARNRLSFTDLSELTTTWHLLAGDKELGKAAVHPALAPLASGDITLQLPETLVPQADTLRLDFDRADGGNVVTYDLHLRPETIPPPAATLLPPTDVKFPHLNFTTVTYPSGRLGWRVVARKTGQLAKVTATKAGETDAKPLDAAALYALPLTAVAAVDADVELIDAPGTKVGHVHVDVKADDFRYTFTWSAKPADVQELGWSFATAKETNRFAWHHQTYWTYYPPTNVGRAAGSATPDSSEVHVTQITRPDAFDFNSTKYNCDWATLTNPSGKGLAITCGADDRQHCRGGFGPDGTYQLIVNQQCSPPQDLSGNVVPDLYLKLAPEAHVDAHFSVHGI